MNTIMSATHAHATRISISESKKRNDRPLRKPPKPQSTTHILSIDGGGIRGVIPATIICYLEEQIQLHTHSPEARISDYIDLMAGTSTGGILVCLYLTPDSQAPKRARLNAEAVLHHYMQDSHAIFDRNLLPNSRNKEQFCQKYNTNVLASRLQETIGKDIKMSQLIRPCLIPAYDLVQASPCFFSSNAVQIETSKDFYAWEIAKASSSAPILFQPTALFNQSQEQLLVDGGLFAKNPSMYAYLEAQKEGLDAPEKITLISIGTGIVRQQHPIEQMRRKGSIGWMKPLLDITTSTSADLVVQQMKQLCEINQHHYFRIEPELRLANDSLDDASEENLQALLLDGLRYIEANKTMLDEIVQTLIED